MSYRVDPRRRARAPFEHCLTKGHLFALVRSSTGKIERSARRAETLKVFYAFRSDLVLVDVRQRLAELPEPVPAAYTPTARSMAVGIDPYSVG